MDSVDGMLDGPRARGAFLLRSTMAPPWAIRIQDEAPLTLVAMVSGDACLMRDGQELVRLRAGDVSIVRGPDPYTLADDPATEPQIVVHPGQRCSTPEGEDMDKAMAIGVRSWGNSPNGSTVMLTGTYQLQNEISRRLLAALPALLVLSRDQLDSPLVSYLADQVVRDEPGQQAVLDRLLDLLLVAALRSWFARPEAAPPGWYSAHSDPVVGRALRLLHGDPARPWTLVSLASEVGISRAGLARRFNELVGEPPMTYLTGWRLSLAADLLREPGSTVGSVASQVGYGSSYALSTAFKRVRGLSPTAHRAAA